jgi:hypothetical protein
MAETLSSADPENLTLDELEALMAQHPPADIHAVHRFTPGLYIRECHIPAGTLVTSATHRTEHPFTISQGEIQVISPHELTTYRAPHTGITLPGTRRLLYAVTDTIWTTYHVTEETDVLKIAEQILDPFDNPLLPGISPGWASQPHNLPES